MGAALRLRRNPLGAAEQQALWNRLCQDASLSGIPYKVETDAHGGILLGPAQARHARMIRRVARLLEERLGGEAITEVAVITTEGVKVPDVVWCSAAFLATHWSDTILARAPDICVEVVSPSNSESELLAKAALYLAHGATEVWLVAEDGAVEIHASSGMQAASAFGFDPAAALAK